MAKQFILFDTEYASWKGCLENGRLDWQKEEIVQIAAVKADAKTLEVAGELNIYVKPTINPVLSDYFINLTGITNELVAEQGVPFEQAYGKFREFSGEFPCFSYDLGNEKSLADGDIMKKNLAFNNMIDDRRPHYINIANWFKKAFVENGLDIGKTNSGAVAKRLGVENELKDSGLDEHNALYDAYSLLAGVRYFKAKNLL